VPLLAGSEEPSLTQNTDRPVLANSPIFFFREHLIYLKHSDLAEASSSYAIKCPHLSVVNF
jgi:hypothetical protein